MVKEAMDGDRPLLREKISVMCRSMKAEAEGQKLKKKEKTTKA